jgi:hypothetical protein
MLFATCMTGAGREPRVRRKGVPFSLCRAIRGATFLRECGLVGMPRGLGFHHRHDFHWPSCCAANSECNLPWLTSALCRCRDRRTLPMAHASKQGEKP